MTSIYECYDAFLRAGSLDEIEMSQYARETLPKFIEATEHEMVQGDIHRRTEISQGIIKRLMRIKKAHDRNNVIIFQRSKRLKATEPGIEYFLLR